MAAQGKEKLRAKVTLFYILKAAIMGVTIRDAKWVRGEVYITDQNIWFKHDRGFYKIPLKSIVRISRDERQNPSGQPEILVVDYILPDSQTATAYLAGDPRILTAVRYNLQPYVSGVKKVEVELTDVDKRVLYLLSTGVKSITELSFLLNVSEDKIRESIDRLRDKEYLDFAGGITEKGARYVARVLQR